MSGIPSWARIGATVVCLDADRSAGQLNMGEAYSISGVGTAYGRPFLCIVGTSSADGGVGRWWLPRFKPLISQADGISTHFHQLLQVPHKIEEKA